MRKGSVKRKSRDSALAKKGNWSTFTARSTNALNSIAADGRGYLEPQYSADSELCGQMVVSESRQMGALSHGRQASSDIFDRHLRHLASSVATSQACELKSNLIWKLKLRVELPFSICHPNDNF